MESEEWVTPGEIVQESTAGNIWFKAPGSQACKVCDTPINEESHPIVFSVEFQPAVGRKRADPISYWVCSRQCAQVLVTTPPAQPPRLRQLEGHPTDPAVHHTTWIYAFREKDDYPSETARSGKWLIFLPPDRIDAAWDGIQRAVKDGRLGDSAKVRTKATMWRDGPRHAICVYTYDGDDTSDVWRVRRVLHEMGFTWKLAWKSDEATNQGQYSRNDQDRRVSRYWG